MTPELVRRYESITQKLERSLEPNAMEEFREVA